MQNHLTWSDTYGNADKFFKYAKNNNNGVPVKFYIYETWHCTNSGIPNSNANFPNGCWYDKTAHSTILWHQRLLSDFPLWSGIVTHVRKQNPGDNQIWMVPAGQGFYNLSTQINAGNVPGITSFRDLFSDDIHLTNAGNYFVACVMYATIYGQSPEGLTAKINNEWGVPYSNMPTPAQATAMQKVAWSTVASLSPWTGVSAVVSNMDSKAPSEEFLVYPNPAADQIKIVVENFNGNKDVRIYNSMGFLVKEISASAGDVADISDLPKGMYLLQLKNAPSRIQKFVKY